MALGNETHKAVGLTTEMYHMVSSLEHINCCLSEPHVVSVSLNFYNDTDVLKQTLQLSNDGT